MKFCLPNRGGKWMARERGAFPTNPTPPTLAQVEIVRVMTRPGANGRKVGQRRANGGVRNG